MSKKEINYAKNVKLKILIGVMYTIIFLILAFLGRNFIILKSLTNKMSEYLNATNYYLRMYNYKGWDASTSEYWVKDGTVLHKFDNVTSTFAKDGVLYNIFDEGYTVSEYTMKEGDNYTFTFDFIENLKTELNNPKSILKYSIKESVVNGKECYRLMHKSTILYFEKETGLLVRYEELEGFVRPSENEIQSTICDYKFEFDCVTDEDIELDVDISKLQQL